MACWDAPVTMLLLGVASPPPVGQIPQIGGGGGSAHADYLKHRREERGAAPPGRRRGDGAAGRQMGFRSAAHSPVEGG
jgi:hypothetical protein